MVKNNPFNVALLLANVSIFAVLFRLIKNKIQIENSVDLLFQNP